MLWAAGYAVGEGVAGDAPVMSSVRVVVVAPVVWVPLVMVWWMASCAMLWWLGCCC